MVSPDAKCFLPTQAGFSCFFALRRRTNKCQHLCQMGAGWNFWAPQLDPPGRSATRLRLTSRRSVTDVIFSFDATINSGNAV